MIYTKVYIFSVSAIKCKYSTFKLNEKILIFNINYQLVYNLSILENALKYLFQRELNCVSKRHN